MADKHWVVPCAGMAVRDTEDAMIFQGVLGSVFKEWVREKIMSGHGGLKVPDVPDDGRFTVRIDWDKEE